MGETKRNKIINLLEKDKVLNVETFIESAEKYIKAIKDCRMLCDIGSVSQSGMSRTLKFLSCEKGDSKYYYRNYYSLFKSLGYSTVKSSNHFRVYGCGMDMVFATNYNIIHTLKNYGFINKELCDKLAQQTPIVI